jgi:hypothetical protein
MKDGPSRRDMESLIAKSNNNIAALHIEILNYQDSIHLKNFIYLFQIRVIPFSSFGTIPGSK